MRLRGLQEIVKGFYSSEVNEQNFMTLRVYYIVLCFKAQNKICLLIFIRND